MNAHRLLWNAAANFETAEFEFYGALAHAAAHESSPLATRGSNTSRLWSVTTSSSKRGPSTTPSPSRAARRSSVPKSPGLKAVCSTLKTSMRKPCVRRTPTALSTIEAIANERAGCFYAARGLERIATAYLRDARSCYRRWGADAKVRQLEQLYPQIGAEESISDATATIQTPVEQLDLATVIKVSEAVVGRDRPGEADRHADAHGYRARRRRARSADSSARG